MKFTLEIELGNDAMQRFGHIARALRRTANKLDEYPVTSALCVDPGFAIKDENGNTVGKWEVTKAGGDCKVGGLSSHQADITVVIFRKWRDTDDVIAIFPLDPGTNDPYTCESYMHVGQHGSCDPKRVITATKPAKPAEYEPLQRELESFPYNYQFEVRQRIPHDHIEVRRKKLAEQRGEVG